MVNAFDDVLAHIHTRLEQMRSSLLLIDTPDTLWPVEAEVGDARIVTWGDLGRDAFACGIEVVWPCGAHRRYVWTGREMQLASGRQSVVLAWMGWSLQHIVNGDPAVRLPLPDEQAFATFDAWRRWAAGRHGAKYERRARHQWRDGVQIGSAA